MTDRPCPLKGCITDREHGHGTGEIYSGPYQPEPTKQREGDQALPTGGQECVQDLVIASMEESKRVGMERYGSTLMTFNGRKGIQDVAEEARDLMVYLAQIEREAQATRETLIEVVAKIPFYERLERESASNEEVAAQAVDAVMGWVTGQRMGRLSTEQAISVVLDAMRMDGWGETYYARAKRIVKALEAARP